MRWRLVWAASSGSNCSPDEYAVRNGIDLLGRLAMGSPPHMPTLPLRLTVASAEIPVLCIVVPPDWQFPAWSTAFGRNCTQRADICSLARRGRLRRNRRTPTQPKAEEHVAADGIVFVAVRRT